MKRFITGALRLIGLAPAGHVESLKAENERRMIRDGDFPFHFQSAEHFATTGRITVPHFLLQVTLGWLYATRLFPTIDAAGLAFFHALRVLTAVVVLWFVAGSRRHPAALTASVMLAVAVLMSAPYLPRSAEPDVFLIGYFPPNPYHNPTVICRNHCSSCCSPRPWHR